MAIGVQEQLQDVLGDAYYIEGELGPGVSRVFLATERSLDRRVMVKLLPPEAASMMSKQRFQREIRVAGNLPHPHILPVLESGGRDGFLYYITPFLEAESLLERLERGPLPLDMALPLLGEVADAIAFAHAHGVEHRDIKPANIFLQDGHAMLVDFGVAGAIERATEGDDAPAPAAGIVFGTPAYMSPESSLSASREFKFSRDLFAFSIVAYETLTGHHPYPIPSGASLVRRIPARDIAKLVPGIPSATARWIMRGLERDVTKRPPGAASFKDTLKHRPRGAWWNRFFAVGGALFLGVLVAVAGS